MRVKFRTQRTNGAFAGAQTKDWQASTNYESGATHCPTMPHKMSYLVLSINSSQPCVIVYQYCYLQVFCYHYRMPGKQPEVSFTMNESPPPPPNAVKPPLPTPREHNFLLTGVGNQNLVVFSEQKGLLSTLALTLLDINIERKNKSLY